VRGPSPVATLDIQYSDVFGIGRQLVLLQYWHQHAQLIDYVTRALPMAQELLNGEAAQYQFYARLAFPHYALCYPTHTLIVDIIRPAALLFYSLLITFSTMNLFSQFTTAE